METPKDEPAIMPAEVAELLGVEVSTLRQWRWRGEGPPHYRISRQRVVYLRSEVLEWRERGRVEPIGDDDDFQAATLPSENRGDFTIG